MKLELEYQYIYGENFYTVYRISFSHNYCIQEYAAQVYTSPSLFTNINEKTIQTILRKQTHEHS
jgi:hypothetical protein